MAYYGDLSNRYLRSRGRRYRQAADIDDRRRALALLRQRQAHEFTRREYNRLPGSSPIKEFLADVAGGPLNWLGLGERAVASVAPDMREYWNPESQFGSDVRWPFTLALKTAMNSGDDILVVSHSLGTLIAWDTFWKFSYYGEYRPYRRRPVSLWVTLGSPLGNETVKDNLKGARATGGRRYPANIVRWHNIAAEDDFISHDQSIEDDFAGLQVHHARTKTVKDHRVYNLAVREGKSNPHSSVGYLIHPKLSELIAAWL
ncbi:MAG: hypothetical protein CL441_09635 [Acidimicrobiaceae bacterium]|nr:hypothetical protein [Acidimicrobiaceae bacterium]